MKYQNSSCLFLVAVSIGVTSDRTTCCHKNMTGKTNWQELGHSFDLPFCYQFCYTIVIERGS